MHSDFRPTIYVDMDCVLADFMKGYERLYKKVYGHKPALDQPIDWEIVYAKKNFFRHLAPMADLKQLWDCLKRYEEKGYSVVILTGVPSRIMEKGSKDKCNWAKMHLGEAAKVICCRTQDKSNYCKPGDILIDDLEQNKVPWTANGGIWITHVDAKTTIRKLQRLNLQ